MKGENGKYARLALFAALGLMLLGAAAKQNANETILIPFTALALFYLPYFIADWVVGRKKAEEPPKEEPFVPFKAGAAKSTSPKHGVKPAKAPAKPVQPAKVPAKPVQPAKVPEKPVQPAKAPEKPDGAAASRGTASYIPPASERGRQVHLLEGRCLNLFPGPGVAHGDRVDLVIRGGSVLVRASNDGYPYPGGSGSKDAWLPEDQLSHYDSTAMTQFIHEEFRWMGYFAARMIQPSDDEVRAFLGKLVRARWEDAAVYSDPWYAYYYAWEKGEILVGHSPVDRMSSDPAEDYRLTREELRGMRKADFCDRFAGGPLRDYLDPDELRRRREKLSDWLDLIGVAFKSE